jgi:hypothetical protein
MTPELQKQVEVEAKDKYPANSTIYLEMRSGYIAAVTPYAEQERQLRASIDLYNNQTVTIMRLEREVERLRKLIKDTVFYNAHSECLNYLNTGATKAGIVALKTLDNFIKENNL